MKPVRESLRWLPPEFPRRHPDLPRRDPGFPGPGTQPGPSLVPEPGAGRPDLDPWLRERLFEQRLVLVRGPLTSATGSAVTAQLLALAATGDGPVKLHLACPDGDLGAAFALVDALDVMRAPVSAVVTGETGGAALAVLAATKPRTAYPHARIRLAEPRVDDVSGTADQIVGQASRHLRMLEDLILRLADVTGKPRSQVETNLSDGKVLTAVEAVEYGLVDEIVPPRSGS